MNVEHYRQSLMSRQLLRDQIKCWGPCSCEIRHPSAMHSPETDPTTKEQNSLQILSPHFTRQEGPAPPPPIHFFWGEGVLHRSLQSDSNPQLRVRALLLWGPHPANLPVNSRPENYWRQMYPQERLNLIMGRGERRVMNSMLLYLIRVHDRPTALHEGWRHVEL